jgi:hypothetical protein
MVGRWLAPGALMLLMIGNAGANPHAERAAAFPDRKQPSRCSGMPRAVSSSGHVFTPGLRVSWVASTARAQDDQAAQLPIELRPATLAEDIDSLAGLSVRLTSARVVGVFDPRVFLVDSQATVRPLEGHRNRVLVFIQSGRLSIPPALLVGSTVTLSGTAYSARHAGKPGGRLARATDSRFCRASGNPGRRAGDIGEDTRRRRSRAWRITGLDRWFAPVTCSSLR